jgi:hypothetical protein
MTDRCLCVLPRIVTEGVYVGSNGQERCLSFQMNKIEKIPYLTLS